jgi:hypothetical protein
VHKVSLALPVTQLLTQGIDLDLELSHVYVVTPATRALVHRGSSRALLLGSYRGR